MCLSPGALVQSQSLLHLGNKSVPCHSLPASVCFLGDLKCSCVPWCTHMARTCPAQSPQYSRFSKGDTGKTCSGRNPMQPSESHQRQKPQLTNANCSEILAVLDLSPRPKKVLLHLGQTPNYCKEEKQRTIAGDEQQNHSEQSSYAQAPVTAHNSSLQNVLP